MDNNQTSFIPKRELYTKKEQPITNRYSIFSIISISLLVVSVLISTSVFIYQKILVKKISTINSELVKKKSAFEADLIDELVKTDTSIETLKTLVNSKTTILPVFSMLEESTLESVRFTNFKYSNDGNGVTVIDLDGEAPNSASVALQSDVLNAYPKIFDPTFSSFSIADNGSVKFNFKANLKKEHFYYKDFVDEKKVDTENGADNIDDADIPTSLDADLELDF